jgi:hypothetical protein
MDKEKIEAIIRQMEMLLEVLKSEVCSNQELSYNEDGEFIVDYDEVYDDEDY